MIKACKLLFTEQELISACVKDKDRSPTGRNPLDPRKLQLIQGESQSTIKTTVRLIYTTRLISEMIVKFCDYKTLEVPKKSAINHKISQHSAGLRIRKTKKVV